MTTRAEVVNEARRWIGTRYRHQASLCGVGCDCVGLLVGVARTLGLAPDDVREFDLSYRGYGRQPDPDMLLEAAGRFLVPVEEDQQQPGDIALFRFKLDPQHFGILSADDYVIHAFALSRKVCETRLDETWSARIVRFYQFRGID